MNINETEIMICDCGKTMPLDAKKIGSGCNSEDEPKIFTALCTDQINYFEEALSASSNNKKTLSIACKNKQNFFRILLKKIIMNRHIFLILEKLPVGLKPLKKHLLKYHL